MLKQNVDISLRWLTCAVCSCNSLYISLFTTFPNLFSNALPKLCSSSSESSIKHWQCKFLKEFNQSLIIVAGQKSFSYLVYCIIVMHIISQKIVISLLCSPAPIVVSKPPPPLLLIHTPPPASLPLPPFPPCPQRKVKFIQNTNVLVRLNRFCQYFFAVRENFKSITFLLFIIDLLIKKKKKKKFHLAGREYMDKCPANCTRSSQDILV